MIPADKVRVKVSYISEDAIKHWYIWLVEWIIFLPLMIWFLYAVFPLFFKQPFSLYHLIYAPLFPLAFLILVSNLIFFKRDRGRVIALSRKVKSPEQLPSVKGTIEGVYGLRRGGWILEVSYKVKNIEFRRRHPRLFSGAQPYPFNGNYKVIERDSQLNSIQQNNYLRKMGEDLAYNYPGLTSPLYKEIAISLLPGNTVEVFFNPDDPKSFFFCFGPGFKYCSI